MSFWKDKRVLVTGGAGVIGRCLVEKLHVEGARVLVVDIKSRPKDWPLAILYSRKAESLNIFKPEIVFHLAAVFERTEETNGFWDLNYGGNVQTSHHLLNMVRRARHRPIRIVFASSYLVYDMDKADLVLSEDSALRPRNLCGAAKLFHETELEFACQQDPGLGAISARIFRVYGCGSRDVISRWVRAGLASEACDVWNPGSTFDYIYADDVAEGLLRLGAADATGVVNLGTGSSRSIDNVTKLLRQHIPGIELSLQLNDETCHEASCADMTRFEQITGWSPTIMLEDAIPRLIEYERGRA